MDLQKVAGLTELAAACSFTLTLSRDPRWGHGSLQLNACRLLEKTVFFHETLSDAAPPYLQREGSQTVNNACL